MERKRGRKRKKRWGWRRRVADKEATKRDEAEFVADDAGQKKKRERKRIRNRNR